MGVVGGVGGTGMKQVQLAFIRTITTESDRRAQKLHTVRWGCCSIQVVVLSNNRPGPALANKHGTPVPLSSGNTSTRHTALVGLQSMPGPIRMVSPVFTRVSFGLFASGLDVVAVVVVSTGATDELTLDVHLEVVDVTVLAVECLESLVDGLVVDLDVDAVWDGFAAAGVVDAFVVAVDVAGVLLDEAAVFG